MATPMNDGSYVVGQSLAARKSCPRVMMQKRTRALVLTCVSS